MIGFGTSSIQLEMQTSLEYLINRKKSCSSSSQLKNYKNKGKNDNDNI